MVATDHLEYIWLHGQAVKTRPSQGRITSSILVGVISYKLRIYAVCRLNNNMRCFEIVQNIVLKNVEMQLNNNMRCFEIQLLQQLPAATYVKQ